MMARCFAPRPDVRCKPDRQLLVTDTGEDSRAPLSPKVQTISAAPLLVEAICRPR